MRYKNRKPTEMTIYHDLRLTGVMINYILRKVVSLHSLNTSLRRDTVVSYELLINITVF